jgi:hypothetical protein
VNAGLYGPVANDPAAFADFSSCCLWCDQELPREIEGGKSSNS